MEIAGLNIKFLPGVGPKRASLLEQELNICSYEDMLYHIPYKYIDRTRLYTIRELNAQLPYIQIKAKISRLTSVGIGKQKRMVAIANDGTGELELIWFKGYKYLDSQILPDKEYLIFGKPSVFNQQLNIVHPEIDPYEANARQLVGFQAVYPTTEKMKKSFLTSRSISKIQANIFKNLNGRIPETLPAWFIKKYNLIYLHDALFNIHFPENPELLRKAQYRLKFEELFYIQLNILKLKFNRKASFKGHPFHIVGDFFNNFYHNLLPFPLTDAQKRVIKEIRLDCGSGKQMNRLLQGDVGSGKTLVAVMCMLIALDNGYQACIMAPTEILAAQHYETITQMLKDTPISVALLTGSTKKKEREIIHEALADGRLQILVGTHALLEDVVCFNNVGLVVIDEQHRFGVAQRAKLWQKNNTPPHMLVMTATPIPRTLAMTLYGDLDVSVIDQLPPGRKPITTYHTFESKRNDVYKFILKELEAGRQAYIVYPLISESEKMDYRNLKEGYEHVYQFFAPRGYESVIVHGKLKPAEKEAQMHYFVSGKAQILVATTVIEVGVNVPNASIMVIESAERFGLSQLHQLRGRVGRGADQSYCILMTSYKLSNDSRKRIETMTSTNDGFEIAEVDLKLRGPGDIEGTQQSGLSCNLRVANLGKDGIILNEAAQAASTILETDPNLSKEENQVFASQVKRLFKTKINWRYIS
ncbi:ATP-dependent DNA helicase RecG [uncultured Sanguibacteroides sp.]|uniref:ATP-dependent DNA helicase RecG n=1 Tax=uncultured Sanguibacteroides sp. TaxID=1635151 RepID=UPI0025E67F2A|nr:ATP-dependent DNA helicase RecG [uncultured Sanguibacteroides sp.]